MSAGTQEYTYHLGGVNTITFVDEGRRFMSTSDDKTIRVFEMGIDVQVRAAAYSSHLRAQTRFLAGAGFRDQLWAYSECSLLATGWPFVVLRAAGSSVGRSFPLSVAHSKKGASSAHLLW